jgi:hypothetical protein
MTKNDIIECINQLKSRWQDKNGLIHTIPIGSDGEPTTLNGVLYTGIVYAMIDRASIAAKIEYDDEIVSFLIQLMDAVYGCLEPKYPLLCRTSTNRDQEGPDDYKGLTAMYTFAPGCVSSDILDYGKGSNGTIKLRWWIPKLYRWLNNTNNEFRLYDKLDLNSNFFTKLLYWPFAPWGYKPWLEPWMGRFPAITFALEVNSHRKPSFLGTFFAAGGLLLQAIFGNSSKPDSWYMDWTLVIANEHSPTQSKLVSLCSKFWYKRLYKIYPNGMKGVWKQYCGVYGDQFPLSKFFLD